MSRHTEASRRPLRRVLVACRGDAAVRVIQACRELSLDSVAVYTGVDARAPHVRLADEAISIGASLDRYLNFEHLLEAARQARADAVHPGYWLLAESPEFAHACTVAGMAFVGPSPEAMRAIGARTSARRLAESLGVPVLPDEAALIRDDAHAVTVASSLGFPLSVSARSGAGGRTLQIVRMADDLTDVIGRVRQEGRLHYGDDAVYLERHIAGLRRVDVDVLGDMHGDAVSLGQRECPVVRGHHRLIELAPAKLSGPLSQRLDADALSLAKGCGYYGAGTFEFLVNGEQHYFLDAARCLQPAQAVTEMVTRIDIVQAQLRIAGGERLWLSTSDVRSSGHAFLCRILAADIEADVWHETGTIGTFSMPTGPGLRVDSAAFSGCDISSLQDSLIAQISTWGPNPEMSRQRMIRALLELNVEGPPTSTPFMLRALRHPRIVDGHLSSELVELVDIADHPDHANGRRSPAVADGLGASEWKSGSAPSEGRRFQVSVEGKPYEVEVAELLPRGRTSGHPRVRHRVAALSDGLVTSPMRGTLVDVAVSEGDKVREGDVLCTVEAMKMENEVRAPHAGVVSGMIAQPGDGVAAGATLMRVIASK